jgi:hypothetical protein
MISLKTQEKFIKSKGWSTWYNPNYWVHEKTVVEPNKQDYTDYGMDLNSAYCFEKLKLPRFMPCFLPLLSQQSQGLANKKRIQKLLKHLEKSNRELK